jgi:hypothetical protein
MKTVEVPYNLSRQEETLADRMTYFRRLSANLLEDAKDPGIFGSVVIAAVIKCCGADTDPKCCAFCRSQNLRVLPIDGCKVEMLPPHATCNNEIEGCRCHWYPLTDVDALLGHELSMMRNSERLSIISEKLAEFSRIARGRQVQPTTDAVGIPTEHHALVSQP